MKLSEGNRQAFLIAAHQAVEEQAAAYVNDLLHGRRQQLDYPPNGGFTDEEETALKQLQDNMVLHSALRKVLASCAAGTVFDLLNLIDGTNDPEHGDWSGVRLVDRQEEMEEHWEFLHDAFFDTYWNWRETRQNTNWRLDLLPD